MDAFFKTGGFKLFKKFEKEYGDCTSICKPPLFYLSLDVSKGKPKNECIKAIVDRAGENLKEPAQYLLLVCCTMLFSICCAFPICSGYFKKRKNFDSICSPHKIPADDEMNEIRLEVLEHKRKKL